MEDEPDKETLDTPSELLKHTSSLGYIENTKEEIMNDYIDDKIQLTGKTVINQIIIIGRNI